MSTEKQTKEKDRELVYQPFIGVYIEIMPELVAQGCKPATAAGVMQARLEG
jgi:hypothetical protein